MSNPFGSNDRFGQEGPVVIPPQGNVQGGAEPPSSGAV